MARNRGRTNDGSWRPDKPFETTDGVKGTLRAERGVTAAGVLKTPLRFQCPPINDLTRPYRHNWSTYDTVGAGQRSRPMGAELLDLSIDTLLMDRIAADAASNLVVWDGPANPQRIIDELRFIAGVDDERKGKKTPFRLVLNQPAVYDEPIVNILATLTSIQPTQRAGHVATEWLSLSFLEWRKNPADRQARHEKPSQRHKVKLPDDDGEGGDTLYELAKKFLHQASAWRKIADANGIKGVSPDSDDELAAWCKKHHKTSLIIPRVELVSRLGDVGDFVGADLEI